MVFAPYSGIGYDKQKAIQDLMTIQGVPGSGVPGVPANIPDPPMLVGPPGIGGSVPALAPGFGAEPPMVIELPPDVVIDLPAIQQQVAPEVTPAQQAVAQVENALSQGIIPGLEEMADILSEIPPESSGKGAAQAQIQAMLASMGPEGHLRAQQLGVEMEIRTTREIRTELVRVGNGLQEGSEEKTILQTRVAALSQLSSNLAEEKNQLLGLDFSGGGMIDLNPPPPPPPQPIFNFFQQMMMMMGLF